MGKTVSDVGGVFDALMSDITSGGGKSGEEQERIDVQKAARHRRSVKKAPHSHGASPGDSRKVVLTLY